MRFGQTNIILICIILIASCAGPTPDTTDRARTQAQARPPAIAESDPANPDRSCRTDADCAVKNVGNCCGYFPACVNKNAVTDPAAVQTACAKEGLSSICGFQEVSGCQCVKDRCENISNGSVAM